MSSFTVPQQKTLASLPKATGFLSMMGSGFIILEIIRDRKKCGQIYHRLMLAMASIDFWVSFFMAMSTWMAPVGSGIVFASGTYASCRAQAFFLMLSVSVPAYNLALAVYYLQVIGYSKRERHLITFERIAHGLVLCHGLGTAIAGLFLNLYHPTPLWCTIAPDPTGKENHHSWYTWGFFGIPLWIFILTVTAIMVYVVVLVKRQEEKVRKWRHGTDTAARTLTKQVIAQAFWYSVSFYVAWVFPTITRVSLAFHWHVPFGIAAAQSFLLPSQGLINFLVYMRPRYERYRRQHPHAHVGALIGRTVGKTARFWRQEAEDDAKDDMNPARDIGMMNTLASNVNESRFDSVSSVRKLMHKDVTTRKGASSTNPLKDKSPDVSTGVVVVEVEVANLSEEEAVESAPFEEAASTPSRGTWCDEFKEEIS